MGAIYEAEHVERGGVVALKVLERARGDEALAHLRFLREARLVQLVRHPNVVSLFEVGFELGRPFLVMELLKGETLSAYLARKGHLAVANVVELFAPITAAVAAIHDARILHRDLKLSNVLLARRGGATEPVVLDFGISRATEEDSEDGSLTGSGGLLGTPSYLSPEQTLNAKAATPLSDVYALGVMLYECLTGERPFAGSSPYEIMHAILNAPVRPPSQHRGAVPAELDGIVLRALSRDPMGRFASVRALGSALLRFGDTGVRERWAAELAEPGGMDSSEADRTEIELRRPAVPNRPRAQAAAEPRRATLVPRGRTWAALGLAAVAGSAFAGLWQAPTAERAFVAPELPPKASAAVPAARADLPATPGRTASMAVGAPPAPMASLTVNPPTPKPVRRRVPAREASLSLARPERRATPPGSPALGRDDALDPFDVP
jgi:serine/threonine-protein kinase